MCVCFFSVSVSMCVLVCMCFCVCVRMRSARILYTPMCDDRVQTDTAKMAAD